MSRIAMFRQMLLLCLWIAVGAAIEQHQPNMAQQAGLSSAQRGDVFTSSFLVRFHRSVDAAQAQHVAIRNGFESVGAVSV